MKFGINIMPRAASADLRDVGQRIEAAGFESLFLPEHTHIPVHGDIHAGGADTHDRMKEMPDPFTALTAVAAVTSDLRIGTGISLIAQHDPISMAKRIATIDQISNGRFMLGVGAGWNRSEAANHGVGSPDRWRIMRENVLAMKSIWTQDQAAFHGRYVNLDEMWSWPKPIQKPHPPVIIGGEGPSVFARVLDYGDAWGPHPVPGVVERISELQRQASESGRGPVPVTLFNVVQDESVIEEYARAGVERCVLYIYDDGPETITRQLDTFASFIRQF